MLLRRTVLAVLATVATGVAGLGVTTAGAQTTAEITWEACPEQVTEAAAECGRIDVPMYHSDPDGAQISVGFLKVPAAGESRGTLFGNPGGPGGDAYSYFGQPEGFAWPEGITDEWDRIAVQPRGLPGSTPVQCDFDNLNIDPVSAYTQSGRVLRDACEQGTPGYTASLTTENTAGDWEAVRQALGEEKISIMGLSYGTFLGSVYATQYPQHTDKVVLDSGMNPEYAWNGILDNQEAGYTSTLHQFFDWLAANHETYGMGETPLAAYQSWSNKVVAETGTNPTVAPPPARVGDLPPALASSEQLGSDALTAANPSIVQIQGAISQLLNPGANQANSPTLTITRNLIPQTAAWPQLAEMISGQTGIPEFAADEEQLMAINTSAMMQSLMLCNENQVPAKPEDIPAYVWTNFVTGDIFSAPSHMFSSGAACAGADPVTGPAAVDGSALEFQPLQIQGTGDPQTPYQDSGRLHELMDTQFVTVHGPGHGHVGLGNEAVDEAVVDYLRTGTTDVTELPGLI